MMIGHVFLAHRLPAAWLLRRLCFCFSTCLRCISIIRHRLECHPLGLSFADYRISDLQEVMHDMT